MLAVVIHGTTASAVESHAARAWLDPHRLPIALPAAPANLAFDLIAIGSDSQHLAAPRIIVATTQGDRIKKGGNILSIKNNSQTVHPKSDLHAHPEAVRQVEHEVGAQIRHENKGQQRGASQAP
ncbi:hypothetical protein [Janthinobacterium sp. UMAB-56]|uniref:hypothetical protein n=1 Tax=Janthinobacterium sp. UMAB-56 TaxID=1365361 RepID=UPI00214B747B|nr:hypothetical protein [Janthinobacterium sp. UMAB-56]